MPGYRPLPSSTTGPAADSARAAESLQRAGDPGAAVLILEEALEASLVLRPELPGWLCGRLAALYRKLGRLEDEVHVLERYEASQTNGEMSGRFASRLSKAQALLARQRPKEGGALASIRQVLQQRTPRRGAVSQSRHVPAGHSELRHRTTLASLLALPSNEEFYEHLDVTLIEVCASARTYDVPLETVVNDLRAASHSGAATGATAVWRVERYSAALVRLLALYYGEQGTADRPS